MKISDSGATKGASKTKKAGTSGSRETTSSGFASHLEKAAGRSESPEITETAPVASMDGILALQAVDGVDPDASRKALYQRGEDILDRLEEIRREIISGAISKERLANLAQTLRARREQLDDPLLIQIIDEIELRAEVEIAKWTRTIT